MAIVEISSVDDYKNKVENSDKISVIDFWAPWCGPCKMLAPYFKEVSEDDEFKNVNFVKINIDEADDLARQFSIRSIPTLIIMKNGEPVDITYGALSADMLRDFIKKNL